ERERDVLDRMVLVDVEVAAAFDLEREPAVLADLLEHVIEEADAGPRDRLRLAVEIDLDADVRFARLALHDRGPRPVEQHMHDVGPRLVGPAVLRDDVTRDADVRRELEVLRPFADDGGALPVENVRREELADEPDARRSAAAALVGRMRADQRRRERDALRR